MVKEKLFRSSRVFARVFDVARVCGNTDMEEILLAYSEELMINLLVSPGQALAVADKYGIRSLTGAAYFAQLMKMGTDFTTSEQMMLPHVRRICDIPAVVQNYEDSVDVLTPERKMRLLCGYWSLTHRWETLSTHPPEFAHDKCSHALSHYERCVETWQHVWMQKAQCDSVRRLKKEDTIGRLDRLLELLSKDRRLSKLSRECQQEAMSALRAMIKQEEDDLADHFQDLVNPKSCDA